MAGLPQRMVLKAASQPISRSVPVNEPVPPLGWQRRSHRNDQACYVGVAQAILDGPLPPLALNAVTMKQYLSPLVSGCTV